METTTTIQKNAIRQIPWLHGRTIALCMWLLAIAWAVTPAYAADDDVPFFAGANGAPNIMFVFDNSDSMQDIPYQRADGRPVRPGTNPNSVNNSSAQDWKWRKGVQLNEDGTVKESAGVVQYDEAAFPSETELSMPEQNPVPLPDLDPEPDTLTGTAEFTATTIPLTTPQQNPVNLPNTAGLIGSITDITHPDRIYDSSLDWTTAGNSLTDAGLFNTNYRYRLVEIRSSTGDVQRRTILGRVIGGAPINTTSYFTFEGANLTYDPLLTYTYAIITDGPGRVTRSVDTTTVTDANINWSVITTAWQNRWITITTPGPNLGLSRKIVGYNATNKAWTVSPGFPSVCDESCRYSIGDERIYDTTLDWSTSGNTLRDNTKFYSNYRYRIVQVVSNTGNIQERTISDRSTSGKYFTIDMTQGAGGPLIYSSDPNELPYTYTILTDGPGRVTRVRPDNLSYVTDADFDWPNFTSTQFDATWRNRVLVITSGKNKDLQRLITGYSTSSKAWTVNTPFPEACDLTTKFKILGGPDDERLAFGGNHPASKLYQAKQAMNLFLTDSSLKTCVATNVSGECTSHEYAVNIGLATYLSARVPRITANYYRIQPGSIQPERYCGRYKRTGDYSASFYHPSSATTFVSSGWKTAPVGSTSWTSSQEHTGVSVGYQFDWLYSEGNCNEQVIRFTVTSIVPYPGSDGSLPDQMKYTVQSRVAQASEGGYWYTNDRCYTVASCAAIPLVDGSYSLIPSGSPCYTDCYKRDSYTTPDLYQISYRDTFGRYNITDPALPRYVDRTTHLVNPWFGYNGSGGTPKNPPFASGDYQLVTTPLLGVPTGYDTNTGVTTYSDIYPDSFDSSYFMYPGYGTTERPHGWSYKKTSNPWIYGQSDSWSGTEFPKVGSAGYSNPSYPWPGNAGGWAWSTWADADQTDPFFPAIIGDEMSNFTGDDQVVFVNLPVYDGLNPSFGDDINGSNIAKILEYIDLTRIPSPNDSSSWAKSFDYTIMPYSRSIAPNAYSAVQYSGTPIAASLADLKHYYTDYIKQDSMTQGGCRNNYVIFLTDGLETGGGNPEEAAKDLMELTIDEESYPIKTYVIGFGLDAASKETLNKIAVAGGTEHAYFATDVKSLVNILVKEITSNIINDNFSRSAPVVTPYVSGSDLQLYASSFDYPSWRGHFYAYDVDPGTVTITGPATGWNSDCDGDASATPDGDAGCEMKHYGRGTVYTSILSGSTYQTITFDPTSVSSVASLKPLVNPFGLDIDGIGGPDTSVDASTIMHYTLDSGYDSGKYKGTRDTSWPLGDIYHSGPVVVSAPTFTPPPAPAVGADPYLGYADFKSNYASRPTRIFVGANDGMVHAFRADNGQENWAYIPNGVLGRLFEFKDGHRFTVDLPLKAVDIYSPGGTDTIWPTVLPGNEKNGWHTLISSGLRTGGYSIFAVDVTDTTSPKTAWEFTDVDADTATRDIGKTWSAPTFARILIDGVRTYVAIFGGGLSAEENRGNNLYIIDAGSGALLKEIPVGSSTNHVPSEILLVTEKEESNAFYRYTTTGYFADTSGDLWKITDLNDAAGGADWDPQIQKLHDGVGKVFYKPALTTSKGGCKVTVGGIEYTINPNTTFILYGTGDEENPTDVASTDRMYEIADPALSPVDPMGSPLRKVWEAPFDVAEKMLTEPFTYLNTVYFVTYTPEGGCAQGESFLWGLTTTKCGQEGNTAGLVYDLYGNKTGGPWKRYSLGAGITSSPTHAGSAIFINTAGGGGGGPGGGGPIRIPLPTVDRLEYWRELLQ